MSIRKLSWAVIVVLVFITGGDLFRAELEAAEREIVSFRLADWKSVHFDNAQSAAASLAALKQIGCEAEEQRHDGHIDIHYRCPRWASISLGSHRAAHQWEDWLKSFGFETAHKH